MGDLGGYDGGWVDGFGWVGCIGGEQVRVMILSCGVGY